MSKRKEKFQKAPQKDSISRRDFLLFLTGGGVVALGGAGVASYLLGGRKDIADVTAPSGKYTGKLKELQSHYLIEPAELNRILDEMANVGAPLLTKVAEQISLLYRSPGELTDFPDWVKNPTPPITKGVSQFAHISKSPSPSTTEFVRMLPNNQFQLGLLFEHIEWGIHIGTSASGDQRFLADGLLLAKEYLTFVLLASLAEQYHKYLSFSPHSLPAQSTKPRPSVGMFAQPAGSYFLDAKAQPITDPALQKKIGAMMMMDMTENKNDVRWRLIDGLPTYLIGSILDQVKDNVQTYAKAFDTAQGIYNRYLQSHDEVHELIDGWLATPDFLFPESIMQIADSPFITVPVSELQDELLGSLPKK